MEIKEFIKDEKINALYNFKINPYSFNENIIFIKESYPHKTVKEYILSRTNCSEERMLASFRMINCTPSLAIQNIDTLSSSEKIKLELSIALILNKEQIFLYQFDKFFMEKDLFFFKKLFKKLVLKYHKTFVLFDCDFSFGFDFVDRFVLLTEKEEIKTFQKEDFYSNELEEYISNPPIMDFIKYVNRDKKVLENYTDIKELIKAIYREV